MCWPGAADCWSKCGGMAWCDKSTAYDLSRLPPYGAPPAGRFRGRMPKHPSPFRFGHKPLSPLGALRWTRRNLILQSPPPKEFQEPVHRREHEVDGKGSIPLFSRYSRHPGGLQLLIPQPCREGADAALVLLNGGRGALLNIRVFPEYFPPRNPKIQPVPKASKTKNPPKSHDFSGSLEPVNTIDAANLLEFSLPYFYQANPTILLIAVLC